MLILHLFFFFFEKFACQKLILVYLSSIDFCLSWKTTNAAVFSLKIKENCSHFFKSFLIKPFLATNEIENLLENKYVN